MKTYTAQPAPLQGLRLLLTLKECFKQQMENSLRLQGMGHRNSAFETEQWLGKCISQSKIFRQVVVVTIINWSIEIYLKKASLSWDNQCPRQKFSKTRISYLIINNYKDTGRTLSESVTYLRSMYSTKHMLHVQHCLISITLSNRSMFLIL